MAEHTVEELWIFLGLTTTHQRNDVGQLMRAKARAQLADLHPASKPAVALINRWLEELATAERQRIIAERQAVLAAWQKYSDGMDSLNDLITNLREINGDDLLD